MKRTMQEVSDTEPSNWQKYNLVNSYSMGKIIRYSNNSIYLIYLITKHLIHTSSGVLEMWHWVIFRLR